MPSVSALRHAFQAASLIIPRSTSRCVMDLRHRLRAGSHPSELTQQHVIAQTTFDAPRKAVSNVSTTFHLPPNATSASAAQHALSSYPTSVVKDIQTAYEKWHARESGPADADGILDEMQCVVRENALFSLQGEHTYSLVVPVPTIARRAQAEVPSGLRIKQLPSNDSSTVLLLTLSSNYGPTVLASTQCHLSLPFAPEQKSLPSTALSALELSLSTLMNEYSYGLYMAGRNFSA